MKALEINCNPRDVVIERYRDFQHRVVYYGIDLEDVDDVDQALKNLVTSSNYMASHEYTNFDNQEQDAQVQLHVVHQNQNQNLSRAKKACMGIQTCSKSINPKQSHSPKTGMFTIYEDKVENQSSNANVSCEGVTLLKSCDVVSYFFIFTSHKILHFDSS